jgi:hypothetical protein
MFAKLNLSYIASRTEKGIREKQRKKGKESQTMSKHIY